MAENDLQHRVQVFVYDCVDELDCECEEGDYGQRHGSSCLRCEAVNLKEELQKQRRESND